LGPLLQILSGLNDRLSEQIPLLNLDWIVSESISFGIALVLFFVIFRFTPYQRQRYTIVFSGTIVSAFLWMLARFVFTIYLAEFRTFSRIYGAYAFLAASAFWIYYAALVFLIGAEVAYQIKQSTWNARRTFHRVAKQLRSRTLIRRER